MIENATECSSESEIEYMIVGPDSLKLNEKRKTVKRRALIKGNFPRRRNRTLSLPAEEISGPFVEEPEDEESVQNRLPLDEFHLPKRFMVHTKSTAKQSTALLLAKSIPDRKFTLPLKKVSHDEARSSSSDRKSYPEARVLVLYTGGTIGMKSHKGVYCPEVNYLPQTIRNLPPLNDSDYVEMHYGNEIVQPYCLPVMRNFEKRLVYWVVEYHPLLDSSDMTFDDWIRIAKDIYDAYEKYDGFVVLHGTDTLAYTASALSFMFENLGKPVIVTGAQIPFSEVRSDGRVNLISSLILAGNFDIPEVTVYFNNKLMRGNRCLKIDNSGLDAFDSPSMLPLAILEINIKVNYDSIFRSPPELFAVHDCLCRNISMLRIFPSITIDSVKAALQPPTQGVVLQTYGAGNMPTRRKDIIDEIRKAIERGCLVVNCSQCLRGQVDANYFTGKQLYDVGVIPGSDMTTETAVTKLSYVIGKTEWDLAKKREMMEQNLRGELTVSNKSTLQDLEIIPELAQFLKISSSHEVDMLRDALFPPLLCHAAKQGNIGLLEKLRKCGADLSMPDYNGRSALHIAASVGQPDVINYLLQHGCNVNVKDRCDENALINAVRSKNLDCIRILLNAGAHLTTNPDDLGSELCLCVSHGDLDTLLAWLLAGADLNQCDCDGRTPLHLAVIKEREDIIQFLLNNGADRNAKDHFGNTAIQEAQMRNNPRIIRLLNKVRKHSEDSFKDIAEEHQSSD